MTNRFKGLDQIDRVPEELRTEDHDIVQETGIKTTPKKKKFKKAKWLSEEVLKIKEKRREAKGKWEKERYTHLNAEFQRIAWRDKAWEIRKASSVITARKERKTIEWERLEISTRNLRDTKGTFHAKIGSIEGRNDMDLTEAEDIKKRWQEYTEELYKKDLHNPDNHDGWSLN